MESKIVVVISALSIGIGTISLDAVAEGSIPENKQYKQKLYKSRANRGYTNHGTVIYNHQEISAYDDALEGEEIGVLDLDEGSHVREVHNTIIIHGEVDSKKDNLEVGKITSKKPGRGVEIENSVSIDGDIIADGETVEIGTVRIGRGSSGRIQNETVIEGGIDAK